MTLEKVLEDSGGFGRFQLASLFILLWGKMFAGWSMFQITFTTIRPDFYCISDPEADITDSTFTNATLDSCSVPSNSSDNSSDVGCASYIYTGDYKDFRTIVTDWNLVCGDAWITATVTSIQMAGLLIGCLTAGQLGDIWGRRWTNAMFVAGHGVSNIAASFATSWQIFAACRFVIGFCIGGVLVVAFVYAMEFLPPRWRPLPSSFPMWAFGVCLYALVAWLLQDWSKMHLVCGIGCLVSLPSLFFIPESLRWLAVQGRLEDAEKVLEKIVRWNGKTMPPGALSMLKAVAEDEKKIRASGQKYTYWDVLRTWRTAKFTLIISYHWFGFSVAYYGISFGISSLAGNFFLNTVLLAVLDIPPQLLAIYTSNSIGRKWSAIPLILLACGCAGGCLALQLTGQGGSGSLVITSLSLVAKVGTSVGWIVMQTWGSELYPTVTRNLGYGIANTAARVGGIMAPQVINFDTHMTLSYIIIAGTLTGSVILMFLTPDTKGKAMLDSLNETSSLSEEELAVKDKKKSIDMINIQSNGFSSKDKSHKGTVAQMVPETSVDIIDSTRL